MTDTRILQVTWAETGALTALDGTKATAQRLQAIVGRLAAQAALAGELGGFAPAARLPAIGEPGHDIAAAMQDVVNQAADSGQLNGAKLPLRAVLWEIGPDGAPRNAEPPLPPGSSWVPKESTRQSDFNAPDGRYFRLYESDVIAPSSSAAWVSGYTRSGLPKPPAATVRAARPWLASALFVLWVASGILLALWLWLAGGFVRAAISKFDAPPDVAFSATCVKMIPNKDDPKILEPDRSAWTPECEARWQKAWDEARTEVTGGVNSGALAWIGANLATRATLTVVAPLIIAMGSIIVLMLAAGCAIKGYWFGALIDDRRYRMSLNRTQQAAWTILIIGSLAIMGWFNAATATGAPSSSAWTLFPYMPAAIWAALGVNLVATPYLSDWILNKKDPALPSQGSQLGVLDDASPAAAVSPAPGAGLQMPFVRQAPLDTNSNPSEASWVDLITGETEGTENQVDLSRVQHLIISGALLSSYFMALANQMGEITGRTIMTAVVSKTAVFASMPTVAQTFIGLLGISHAGFLVFKATATAAPTGGAGDQSAKSKT
jgi:hypothetical protein